MAGYLRQSTVSTVKLGPFVSPTDGLTAFTSGGFAAKVGANGGALAARHDATAITHDADGYYAVEIDATDTASVGRLKLEVPGSAGNYLPVWDEFVVLNGAVYDVLLGTTAPSTYAGGDTSGTTTLLSRLTSGRATGLDNLDAAVSTRSTYAGGAVASVTGNVGGNVVGSVASVTAAVTLPSIPANWITAAGINAAALNGKGDWLLSSSYSSPPSAAAIAAAVLTDTADLTTSGSVGYIVAHQLGGAFTTSSSSVFSTASLANAPTGGGGGLSLSTTLNAARDVGAIADTSLTLNDAFHCAIAAAAGKESVSGTTYVVKTPSTGTTIRSFTLDSGTAPTSRT